MVRFGLFRFVYKARRMFFSTKFLRRRRFSLPRYRFVFFEKEFVCICFY